MPSPAGSNFVVHGTTPTGTQVAYGPFNKLQTAINVASEAVQDGSIVDYYITYTDVHGNEIQYDQV